MLRIHFNNISVLHSHLMMDLSNNLSLTSFGESLTFVSSVESNRCRQIPKNLMVCMEFHNGNHQVLLKSDNLRCGDNCDM